MVRLTLPLTLLRWTIVASIVNLLISPCVANYLRETTASTRELQSLPTIDNIVLNDPNLTTLAAAFETAGLVGRLCNNCNYTAFAPINDAFDAVDQTFLATLLTPSWILHLQNLLAFHATRPTADGDRLLSTDYVDGQVFQMLNFENLTASDLKSGITLSSPLTVGSRIVEADILASNGAVQKVDTVLSPAFIGVDVFALGDSYTEFTILQELMESIELAGTDGEYTILAPTNEAFLALGNETLAELKEDKEALGRVLANHVIVGVYPSIFLANGVVLESIGGFNITVTVSEATARQVADTTIMFNDATVILADVLARNGIVHAIPTVLLDSDPISNVPFAITSDMPSDAPSSIPSDIPSTMPSDVPSDAPSDVPTSIPSIFDVGEIDPELTILDDLFEIAGLDDLEGEFTLLAPDNDAWLALGNDTLARLQNNIDVLGSLLRNHLIAGIVAPTDLVGGASLTSIGGLNVTVPPTIARSIFIAAQQSTFMFNDAISSDIYYAGNGIVYKIDIVLSDPLFPDTDAPLAPIAAETSSPVAPSLPITSAPLAPIPLPTNSPVEPSLPTSSAPQAAIPSPTSDTEPPSVETSSPTESPIDESTPAPSGSTLEPSPEPSSSPSSIPTPILCINFDCGDGYNLISNARTRPGNDRATCCYFAGICAGAPFGSMCVLGDIGSSLISNPSFEDFSECPNAPEQVALSIGWIEGGAPEEYNSSLFVQSPTCNDTWYRNGAAFAESSERIGSIPQNAADGNGFVGTYLEFSYYASYIGTCLNDPLTAGVEYTLTLNVASPEADFDYGGDTNGATDLICIPDCSLLPYDSCSFSGSDFEVLATAEPFGGLIGGGDWKAITFNFVPSTNCSAIVIGPNEDQTSPDDKEGSYVLYDYLNLQEGAPGVCNLNGECVAAGSFPTTTPTTTPSSIPIDIPSSTPTSIPSDNPSSAPSEFCIDNDRCDDRNFCTIDTCTPGFGCENVPVECGDNQACDPMDGSCKDIDAVRPCIAIIDESDDFPTSTANALWKLFRTTYPFRPFCLLIPNEPSVAQFFFPTDPDFLNDNRTATAYVNRDDGNVSLASNYLNECGYSNLATNGVDYVGLFVDESGSMNRYTVRASLNLLFRGLEEDDITYCTVVNGAEDWITPFNTELGENCTSNIIIDFPATSEPTIISDFPTSAPFIPV